MSDPGSWVDHLPLARQVRDVNGELIGYQAACTCGWTGEASVGKRELRAECRTYARLVAEAHVGRIEAEETRRTDQSKRP